MKKLDKIRIALKGLLMDFSSISTDKATLTWDGDEEIAVDTEVYVIDENGEHQPVEDGEYVAENGTIYVIENNRVKEIKEPAEEPAAEEPAEETPAEELAEEEAPVEETPAEPAAEDPAAVAEEVADEADELTEIVESIVEKIAVLEEEVKMLKEFKATMAQMSAAAPAHQEFSQAAPKSTKDKDLKNLGRLFN